jgi:hypothetical protein
MCAFLHYPYRRCRIQRDGFTFWSKSCEAAYCSQLGVGFSSKLTSLPTGEEADIRIFATHVVKIAPPFSKMAENHPRRTAFRLGAVRLGLGEWRRLDMPLFLE